MKIQYTDKELEGIIIKLRKKRNNGQITDREFYDLRASREDMFTSSKAFISSINDPSYSEDDCKCYLKQYLTARQKFEKLIQD